MDAAEDNWFANSEAGPSLEDFLATDPSQLPFLQERPATPEDVVRYQIFTDDWESIDHLQQVGASRNRGINNRNMVCRLRLQMFRSCWRFELA